MCDPILVTPLKMRAHYSQSSRENATPSSGTSPLAPYKELPPRELQQVEAFLVEAVRGHCFRSSRAAG